MQQDKLIQTNAFESFQLGMVEIFNAWKLKLSLAEVFEPDRFVSQNQPWLQPGYLLVVRATDGWCWARVTQAGANKSLILEREAPLSASPEPTVKLSRKAA